MLKSSGRGIFLIRNFMDDVQLRRAPEGGMEIRMIKRVQPGGDRSEHRPEWPSTRCFSTTADRGGRARRRHEDGALRRRLRRSTRRATIDLVTEVDVAVERMFRALIAERFPDHAGPRRGAGRRATVPAGPCWVFDPIDGTTNYAHGAADLLRVARARDRRRGRGRRRLRSRRARSCSPPSGAAARS